MIKLSFYQFKNLLKFSKTFVSQQKSTATIHISKFSNQYNGFLLYQCNQVRGFRMLNIAFALFASYSAILYFIGPEQYKIHQLVTGSIAALGLVLFQIRMRNTVKNIILDKRGENMIFANYRLFTMKESLTSIQIPRFEGISKLNKLIPIPLIKYNDGNKIHRTFFNSCNIIEKQIFQQAVNGKYIKVIHYK